MSLSKKDIREMIEVITLAIPKEIEAYDSYVRAANASKAEESRKLFLHLAQQERGHEKILKDLLADLLKQLNAL